jgi:hypothetical protein
MLLSKTKPAHTGAAEPSVEPVATPPAIAASTAAQPGWHIVITLSIFFGFLALYLLTRTANYTFDAVSYAQQIVTYTRTGDRHWLFHPHHLLFNLMGYEAWRAAQFFGYRGGPLPVIQDINAAFGAAGISLLWLTLRRILSRSRGLAALFAIGLGLSFGYWVCATDARVNMPSLVLLIAAFFALIVAMQSPNARSAAVAGGIAGLAALFHESAGLFLIAGWVGIALADYTLVKPFEHHKARWKTLGFYTLAWALVFAVPYLLIGTLALHLTSFGAYRHWSTEYAELGWWWNFHIGANLAHDPYTLRGALFVQPESKAGYYTTLQGTHIGRTLYYIAIGGWLIAVYFGALAFASLFKTHYRPYLVITVVWAAVYAAFFTIWNPGYFVFWVPAVIACATLLAICASYYRARRAGALWLAGITIWVVCFGLSNYLHSIGPNLSQANNHFLMQALDMRAHSHPGDLVVLTGEPYEAEDEVYIPYFAKRDVFSLHTEMGRHNEDKAAMEQDLQGQINQAYASGHVVYALDDIWHSRKARGMLADRHHLYDTDLAECFSRDNRTLAWRDPRGVPVWKLTPIARG